MIFLDCSKNATSAIVYCDLGGLFGGGGGDDGGGGG